MYVEDATADFDKIVAKRLLANRSCTRRTHDDRPGIFIFRSAQPHIQRKQIGFRWCPNCLAEAEENARNNAHMTSPQIPQ